MDITRDVMRMYGAGEEIGVIHDYVVDKYSKYGPPTSGGG